MDIRGIGSFQPLQGPAGVGFNQPIAKQEPTQQPIGDQLVSGGQSDLGLIHKKMMIIDNKEVVTKEAPAQQVAEQPAEQPRTQEKGITRNPSVLTLGDDDSFYGDFGKTSVDFAFGPNNLSSTSLKGVLNNVDFGGSQELNWGGSNFKNLTEGL